MSWDETTIHLDYRMRQTQKRNTLHVNVNESLEHFLKKAEICYNLRNDKKHFYTEAIFVRGQGRADIYVIDEDGNYAIEIVHTEDIEVSGKAKYPCPVKYEYTIEGKKKALATMGLTE